MAQLLIACALVSQRLAEFLNSGLPCKGYPIRFQEKLQKENSTEEIPTEGRARETHRSTEVQGKPGIDPARREIRNGGPAKRRPVPSRPPGEAVGRARRELPNPGKNLEKSKKSWKYIRK